jgi:sugar-specific transcriptional regulator TrmB
VSLDDEAQLLVDYGLTGSQAIVYLTTVRLGVALVSKISKVSAVRREDVYRTMTSLEEMGLTERMPTKPTRIRAVPLEQGIAILIKHQKDAANRKISELTARKDEVLKRIRSRMTKPRFEEKQETEFALLSSKEEVLKKVNGMIQGAEREIDTITSADEFANSLSPFSELLKKTIQMRVKIRAILEIDPHQNSIIHRIKEYALPRDFVDLRYSHRPLGHYFITDFKQVLMATSPTPPIGHRPYLWTCNNKFVEIMCGNFEETWHACMNTQHPKLTAPKEEETSTRRQ